MDFMGIGPLELLIILILVLIAFGPDKMIETARTLGKYARKLQLTAADLKRQINAELDKETSELKDEYKEMSSEVSGALESMGEDMVKDTSPSSNDHTKSDGSTKKRGKGESETQNG